MHNKSGIKPASRISGIFRSMVYFWYPVHPAEHPGAGSHYVFSISVLYVLLFVQLFYGIRNHFSNITNVHSYIILVAGLVSLSIIRYSRHYLLQMFSILAAVAMGAVGSILIFADFPYTILLWMPVYAGICFYVLPSRAAWWGLGAGNLFVILALVLRNNLPIDHPRVAPEMYDSIAVIAILFSTTAAAVIALLFSRSITRLTAELAGKNRALVEQYALLEESNRSNLALLSMILHDISNPLSVILVGAEYGLKGTLDDPAEGYTLIHKAARKIKTIVDDVAHYQAVILGKAAFTLEKVNLAQLLEQLRDFYHAKLSEKKLTLHVDCPEGVAGNILAHKSILLNSVLSNLLSNAIKFSDQGKEIALRVYEQGGQVKVMLKDSGIGIPPAMMDDLFKINTQTSRIGTAGEPGYGFGLPIVKTCMEKFGGSIEVNSVERKPGAGADDAGTTFILSFKKAER